jgi:hypothetical protein
VTAFTDPVMWFDYSIRADDLRQDHAPSLPRGDTG